MPSGHNIDTPFGVQFRLHRAHLAAQDGLGEDHVELRQDVQVVRQESRVRCDLRGQRGQDALDLLFLFGGPLL